MLAIIASTGAPFLNIDFQDQSQWGLQTTEAQKKRQFSSDIFYSKQNAFIFAKSFWIIDPILRYRILIK